MSEVLTPIQRFGDWFAKREDLAARIGPERCSGSKVRQYLAMGSLSPGKPCVVGCSANGSMQLYVADAAKRLGVEAHVFVPQRKKRTSLTEWAEAQGATIHHTKCGWGNHVRLQAREFAKKIGGCVRWDRRYAVEDTVSQVLDLPDGVKRIVTIAGSGLTAKGISIGLIAIERPEIDMLLVDVCGMVRIDRFLYDLTSSLHPFMPRLPKIDLVVSKYKYGQMCSATLPNGEPLDGNYAAKCVEFLRPGDLLWVAGIRPLSINV